MERVRGVFRKSCSTSLRKLLRVNFLSGVYTSGFCLKNSPCRKSGRPQGPVIPPPRPPGLAEVARTQQRPSSRVNRHHSCSPTPGPEEPARRPGQALGIFSLRQHQQGLGGISHIVFHGTQALGQRRGHGEPTFRPCLGPGTHLPFCWFPEPDQGRGTREGLRPVPLGTGNG